MVQVKWTIQAKSDLRSIFDYISIDSAKYAQRQIQGIIRSTTSIRDNSKIGRIVPELKNPKVREVIVSKYRIIYHLKNEHRIDILTVHHSSKDFPDLLIA